MKTVIVRYKVRPEFVEKNKRLVKAVCDELKEKKATGLRYAMFLADDGVTFFHVALVEAAENPLLECASFHAFKQDIDDRCIELPDPVQMSELESFNFFA